MQIARVSGNNIILLIATLVVILLTNLTNQFTLESQLLEEPLVLSGFVPRNKQVNKR